MASKARNAFDQNAVDIQRLLELHGTVGGDAKGRRYGLEVLNKSAIVLITSFWESYCEDIASEALDHIVKHAKSSEALPEELKKQLAREIKSEKHELEAWKLADNGWRNYLTDRSGRLTEERNRKLNTPKTDNIEELFLKTVGVESIATSWKWGKKMSSAQAREKLDKIVELRGAIAHRGKNSTSVTKAEVIDFFDFIKVLVARTGGSVNAHVKMVTGIPLWEKVPN